MLQNTRITAFTVSELLRENQQGGGGGGVGVKLPRLRLSNLQYGKGNQLNNKIR